MSMLKIGSTLSVAALFGLSGCFYDSNSNATASANILPPVQSLLTDLPSSVTGHAVTTTATGFASGGAATTSDTLLGLESQPYIPAIDYIYLSNQAKNSVRDLVYAFNKAHIPEKIDTTIGSWHVVSNTVDTTILGTTQKLFNVQFDSASSKSLSLNYWKNASGQYRGNFYLKSDSGLVALHFNNQNAQQFGSRMVVVFYRPQNLLATPSDPSVVKVVANRFGDKVWASGASYHPTFTDTSGFWTNGPRFYGFRAAASTSKDLGLLSVSFATAAEVKAAGGLFVDSLMLNNAVARQTLPIIQKDTNLVAWYNLIQYGTNTAKYQAASNISYQNLETFAGTVLASNDTSLTTKNKAFLALLAIPQPIVVAKNASFVGAIANNQTLLSGASVSATDLAVSQNQIETIDPNEVQGVNSSYVLPDQVVQ